MATFESPQTHERSLIGQLEKVVKIKGIDIKLPLELGTLWLPSPFEQQETIVPQAFPRLQQEWFAEAPSREQVYRSFIAKVSSIPQVRFVAVHFENNVIHVWTVIPTRDKEVQRKIYEVELQLMDQFPTFSYDFNILFCADDDLTIALPSEAEIIYPSS